MSRCLVALLAVLFAQSVNAAEPGTDTPADPAAAPPSEVAPEPAANPSTAVPSNTLPPRTEADDPHETVRAKWQGARDVIRDGNFLPTAWSPRVGSQYATGMAFGGYSTAAGQGGLMTGIAEGAIARRVAIRAGVEYRQGSDAGLSAGVRVNILGQERFGFDLGAMVQYKNVGFNGNGELEMAALAGRRWNRFAVLGNFVYGQGLEQGGSERDCELRLGMLYDAHDRVTVGLDGRARFNAGQYPERAQPIAFDFIGGPLVATHFGPVILMAQTGAQTLIKGGQTQAGFVALGGIGAAY